MSKVIFIEKATKEQIAWGSCDDPNEKLTVGKVYELENKQVHAWHTKYKIRGIEGWFNGISFKRTIKQIT